MKFEYKILQGTHQAEERFNKLGDEGWGLVAVVFDTAYFMRERQEEQATEPAKTVTRRSEKK